MLISVFEFVQYPTAVWTVPAHLAPVFVLHLVLPHAMPDHSSFLLGDVHGSAALSPGPGRHPSIDNAVPLIELLKTSYGDPCPGWQNTSCVVSFPTSHYVWQTQPSGATSSSHHVDGSQTPRGTIRHWDLFVLFSHPAVDWTLLTSFEQSPGSCISGSKRSWQTRVPSPKQLLLEVHGCVPTLLKTTQLPLGYLSLCGSWWNIAFLKVCPLPPRLLQIPRTLVTLPQKQSKYSPMLYSEWGGVGGLQTSSVVNFDTVENYGISIRTGRHPSTSPLNTHFSRGDLKSWLVLDIRPMLYHVAPVENIKVVHHFLVRTDSPYIPSFNVALCIAQWWFLSIHYSSELPLVFSLVTE